MKTIGPVGLSELMQGERPPRVVDVRLPEDHGCCRVPGAVNNCVYEVAFRERMAEIAPDPSQPVVVYGAKVGSLEGRMAAEKLERLEYADVHELEGGIAAWQAAGLPVDEGPGTPADSPAPRDGRHPIDLKESRIHWIGRNLLNRHEGQIALKAGEVLLENGRLAGGSFVIDMTAITCLDLAGDPLHEVLIGHLRDHDFFDAELFPEARYEITGVQPIMDATPGAPNVRVAGQLTLKDVTAPLEFTACAGVTDDGKLAAQATLAFDRTLWNVLYGSGKWFHRLGGHLVNDLIELQLRIVAE